MQQPHLQVMDLTEDSQAQQAAHQTVLDNLEITKLAGTLTNVPTLPQDVRQALRQMGQPVRLFGENLADVRQRLRIALAQQEFEQKQATTTVKEEKEDDEEEEQVTKYTRASPELIQARQAIAAFSMERSKLRLERERQLRTMARSHYRKRKKTNEENNVEDEANVSNTDMNPLQRLDAICRPTYQHLRQVTLEGSQYADRRALTSICQGSITMNEKGRQPFCVTAGWTASVQLWDVPSLMPLGEATLCHEDRIMAMDLMSPPPVSSSSSNLASNTALLVTASIDTTAKLWKIQPNATQPMLVEEDNKAEEEDPTNNSSQKSTDTAALTVKEVAHLRGHQARLCRTRFHPLKRHVATTSFDHTWRLWDIETGQDLLLQDGHAAPVFGLSFHNDGSLCAATDFATIIHLWDLRTGKSIHHWAGQHAKRILSADFAPNGFHLATAGDDGVIAIWDLRRRKQAAAIPAHSSLISQVKFLPPLQTSLMGEDHVMGGECLASSSFDGTVKLWSARDWKPLNTLRGHAGQVSDLDFVPTNHSNKTTACQGLVTCGFDKTLKYWS